jgi:AraC family transcriptional regulator of adaptative response/methylated-DNA-[protein]-cysteine methyltransferase
MLIHWTTMDTASGPVAVGASERGVCAALFLDGDDPESRMRDEFPGAVLQRDDTLGDMADEVREALQSGDADAVPLDPIGTEFQRSVWDELRRIPTGETRSYAEVARSLGRPSAVRAVANACGQNHIAVLIPCHRVVRSDGTLGGYRSGLDRKRSLLDAEARAG